MAKKLDLSRREFLLTAGAAGIGAILPGSSARADGPGGEGEKEPKRETVPLRPFGKTGVEVPVLALGGIFDIPNNQIVLAEALAWGVTYWDTAEGYEGGKSEEGIGAFFERNPEARKKVFLVTKSEKRSPKGLTASLDRSLERMKTDVVDLFFLHGVRNVEDLSDGVKKWAEEKKAAKKIRFFGFSAHSNMAACLAGAARLGWIDGVMATLNYRVLGDGDLKAALEACAKAGVGVTAMKTQGKGLRWPWASEPLPLDPFLERGFSEFQAKLKAVWEIPAIASICSQMPNVAILKANVAAALDKVKLSETEKKALYEHSRAGARDYCAGCTAICESALPEPAPVGDILRHLMYARGYGEPARGRRLFEAMPEPERRRLLGLDYSLAESRCPQRLAIGALVREAIGLLA